MKTSTLYAGKDNYMAPEVRQQDEYSNKCDIFSLGVLLYYLCGRSDLFNSKIISNVAKPDESHQVTLKSQNLK